MKKFNKNEALNDKNRGIIGSLLSEVSWEGSKVKRYRDGGKGLENVLTTEVLQILYFLPRTIFLGEIIKNLNTRNERIKKTLYEEIENSDFNLFPGNFYLIDEPISHQKGIAVQPDALLITNSVYSLIEAKRIKRGSFQKEQLAREYYLVTREAKERDSLLILIIPNTSHVNVQGNGKVDPLEYIKRTLPQVYASGDSHQLTLDELIKKVDRKIAWITWQEIFDIIKFQQNNFVSVDDSMNLSINRLCQALFDAIERHS